MDNTVKMDKKRFEAFIDAIFAIVITFLVLEFKVPKIENATTEELKAALIDMLPRLICYIISFFTIVVIWLDHHKLFLALKHLNRNFALLNFLFVLTVSALPFTTEFAGEYYTNAYAVAVFCGSILLMNIIFTLLYMYPIKRNMYEEEFKAKSKENAVIPMIGIVIEIACIPICYWNTIVAILLGVVVVIMHLLKRS